MENTAQNQGIILLCFPYEILFYKRFSMTFPPFPDYCDIKKSIYKVLVK